MTKRKGGRTKNISTMRGADLRALRSNARLSQRDAAAMLGVHPNTLARMERGEMTISQTLALLAPLVLRTT